MHVSTCTANSKPGFSIACSCDAINVLRWPGRDIDFFLSVACAASVSVGFLFLILALAPISRGQNTVPVPFLGLSLLSNSTETLVMQAILSATFLSATSLFLTATSQFFSSATFGYKRLF